MAEGQDDTEKTEEPTQKRLDDALKRGDVAKSQEVNTWFIFAGGALAHSRAVYNVSWADGTYAPPGRGDFTFATSMPGVCVCLQ